MVKLGFIVEGATEMIILQQSDFFSHLDSLGILYIPKVVNAEGSNKMLYPKLEVYIEELVTQGATNIFMLTDLDEEQCITNTKRRIDPHSIYHVMISIKAIEAWYLADTKAMRKYLADPTFTYDQPELSTNPFEE